MFNRRIWLVLVALTLLAPATASADITAFLGTTPTPVNRLTTGLSLGMGLVIVGFEFEYAHTRENLEELAPSVRTYMFNGLLQTPVPIAGMQFYGTAGGGVYRETLNCCQGISETNVGLNVGGGVKVNLAGPLRLRLDYRVFTPAGQPAPREAAALLRGCESEVLREETRNTSARPVSLVASVATSRLASGSACSGRPRTRRPPS